MSQQARKQLETELEMTLHSFGDVCCLSSPVHSPVRSIVQSSAWSFYRVLLATNIVWFPDPSWAERAEGREREGSGE